MISSYEHIIFYIGHTRTHAHTHTHTHTHTYAHTHTQNCFIILIDWLMKYRGGNSALYVTPIV